MSQADPATTVVSNPSLARRMAIIAFLNQNITIGCLWGSFSVMLSAVEARLGIGREASTAALPLATLVIALGAPVAGGLAARTSLRLLMVAGAALSVAGFLLLASTDRYSTYLFAYSLPLGGGMAIATVSPATLVTRWFTMHRGRALGFVCLPIASAIVPLIVDASLRRFGVSGTYGLLAAISTIPLFAGLFVIDRPYPVGVSVVDPEVVDDGGSGAGLMAAAILRTPRFWTLGLGFIASITGSMILSAHIAPIARWWGLSATQAALLLAMQSFAGMAGTLVFGWVADRAGGAVALALILFGSAILWLLLLLPWSFATTMVLVGLIGAHGAGAIPALGVALSSVLGRNSFSRAYGLLNLINLPFAVSSVPIVALVSMRTESFVGPILGEAVFLGLGGMLVLSAQLGGTRPRMASRSRMPSAGIH